MKKNKLMKLVGIIAIMIFCLIGCGSEAQQESEAEAEPEIVYADEAFINDFAKALEARWDLNAKDENSDDYEERVANDEEWKNMMLSYINAELDVLSKYTEEKFEDSNLQEMAVKYINLLKSHVEICDYITVDYVKYDEEFQPIYDGRSKVIATLVESYGLTVSEEHQKTLDDFLTKAKLVESNENVKNEIQQMIDNIVFEKVEDSSGWKTYNAVIENTTSKDFAHISFNINLLDKDEIIVESTYDSIENLAKGAKARIEFSTDKDFEKTEVVADYWE